MRTRMASLNIRPRYVRTYRWRVGTSHTAISFKPHSLPRTYSFVAYPRPPGSKQVIFSGIQPTGVPHLGNYLGALRQWVLLQNADSNGGQLIFSIADLHALTVPQEPSLLRQWRRQTLAILLAVGLDPKLSTIFYQSAVPAHTELMWILSTIASTGYLSRMTQWKSKLQLPEGTSFEHSSAKSALRLGLFSYPVLQAADILVHRATHVPTGDDQKQNIELTRYIANTFNNIYGQVFPIPEAIVSPAGRVMSLREPTLKMSKSHPDPRSRILLTDSPEEVHSKIRLALTDSESEISYDPIRRPGISNLIEILSHFECEAKSCDELALEYKSTSIRSLKEHVAKTVSNHLDIIRERFADLIGNENDYLDTVADLGAQSARTNANYTIESIKVATGL